VSVKPVLQKLLLKPGARAAVLNAPAAYAPVLEQLPSDVQLSTSLSDGPFDFLHAFLTRRDELLQHGPGLRGALKPGGVLWVSYPKGKVIPTDLNRDIVRTTAEEVGLQTVSQIAIDETWSALRLKPV
jgi:hypothetical protein